MGVSFFTPSVFSKNGAFFYSTFSENCPMEVFSKLFLVKLVGKKEIMSCPYLFLYENCF